MKDIILRITSHSRLKCFTENSIDLPESDTNTSPSLAALDKVFFALLVSNFGVIIGVLACLGGRCLGVTREVFGPFLEDFAAEPLFSFPFLLFFMVDLM